MTQLLINCANQAGCIDSSFVLGVASLLVCNRVLHFGVRTFLLSPRCALLVHLQLGSEPSCLGALACVAVAIWCVVAYF